MCVRKVQMFIVLAVLILSAVIIQNDRIVEAENAGILSSHVYKASPTGYVCGTTPPTSNILETQFVPDDANHNIEVRVKKCAGGNLTSNGNAYVRVDNFKDYTYEVSTTDYVCGTTPPTQGIVELRLTPDDTNHDLYVRIRKCDSGDFSQNGEVYITVDGVQRWGPFDYDAGDSSVRFDIDPVGHSEGIVGQHTYQAEVYPTGQTEPILSGEIDAWEGYATYTWGPFPFSAGISEFSFDIDPVDEKGLAGTHTYQVHWYPTGQDDPIRTGAITAWDEAVTSNADLTTASESIETIGPFYAGSSIGVQALVVNTGSENAPASHIGYWAANTSNGNPINTDYKHTTPVQSISAGSQSDALYEDVGIPVGTAPGAYCIVFEADTENTVAESDENNNRASLSFTISPCDTSNMYCDVLSDRTFREEIEALRDEISNGCRSATNDNTYQNAVFCPDTLLERGPMAVFAVRRKLGLYDPTLGTYQGIFIDVPADRPFALWIEKAYDLGIVGGCEGSTPGVDLKYCPDYDTSGWAGIVTRSQMAIFLTRIEEWDPSQPTTGVFDDVTGDGEWERAVEYMYWQGYIHGAPECQNSNPSGDLVYCGSDYVNRGMAAGFMSRAFRFVDVSPRCANLTITMNPPEGGTVQNSVSPNCPIDNTKFQFDTDVTLTAIPNSGYSFNSWRGIPGIVVNPTTFKMGRQNRAITTNFAAGTAPPSPSTYSLSGNVTDLYGNPLPNVEVTLVGPSVVEVNYAHTDGNGNYAIGGLMEGRYLISAYLLHNNNSIFFNPNEVWIDIPPNARQDFQAKQDIENPNPPTLDEIPYVHQLWSTEEDFAGWGACGPASLAMLLAWYDALEPKPLIGNPGFESAYGWYITNSFGDFTVPGWDYKKGGGTCSGIHFYGLNGYANPVCEYEGTIPEVGRGYWKDGKLIGKVCKCGSYAAIYNNLGRAAENLGIPIIKNGSNYYWTNARASDDILPGKVIKDAVDQGHLVLLQTRLGKSNGHIVLVRGYDENQGKFIVSDPYGRASCKGCWHDRDVDGRDLRYSWAELDPGGIYVETQNPAPVFLERNPMQVQNYDASLYVIDVSQIQSTTMTMTLAGGRKYVNHQDIWVFLNVADAAQMRFSFDSVSWTDWEDYVYAKLINLPEGDGTKSVYAEVRDSVDPIASFSATIILDTVQPTGEMELIDIENGWIKYRIYADDSAGEINKMIVSQDASFTNAEWGDSFFQDIGAQLSSGTTIYAKVQDEAGNISEVLTLEASPSNKVYLPLILKQ